MPSFYQKRKNLNTREFHSASSEFYRPSKSRDVKTFIPNLEDDGVKIIPDTSMQLNLGSSRILNTFKLEKPVENDSIPSTEKNPIENCSADDETEVSVSTKAEKVEPRNHFVDNEVIYVGSTGLDALTNYPHSREHCIVFPIRENPEKACTNCFCYVCDEPAKSCLKWSNHCRARSGLQHWKLERADIKLKKMIELSKSNCSTSNNTVVAPLIAISKPKPTSTSSFKSRLSEQIVHRDFHATNDRNCHTQINGFFRASNILSEGKEVEDASEEQNETLIKGNSASALLEMIIRAHPEERSPPSIFTTTLRHYQRQSLAFMISLETSTATASFGKYKLGSLYRGGWLASEVGMGKSAIIIALVATSSFSESPQINYFGRKAVKTTVVLTSVSLMGQWEDECQKHCPSLTVRRFHPSSRSKLSLDLRDFITHSSLENIDILISTATFQWPACVTENFDFSRVVMDESHLFSNVKSANIHYALKIISRRRWCVTATPCTASISDLKLQLSFLRIDDENNCGLHNALERAMEGSTNHKETKFFELANELSKHMIRHVKTQSKDIKPELILPSCTTQIVSLKMSPNERYAFDSKFAGVAHLILKYKQNGVSSFTLEQKILHPLNSDCLFENGRESSKIAYLMAEMKTLLLKNTICRVIIFTQYTKTHKEVTIALKSLFYNGVYKITGASTATDRDYAIRCFQSPNKFPAAMVITVKAGSAGMTLTSASHLYLMEPCLDPATEIQIAGRIHRLGQNKSVVIKKIVHQESLESNMLTLHHEIASGKMCVENNFLPAEGMHILTG
eukprot:CAMPEP_0194373150 /NCGR_PEP_ID=MMETSP0174-20130528/21570_1 /TAXON_ID=216777 /ORGANISM="Proboscia alata, Strain PI-D3" /LENGTH=796 /DNA_ID=CAMNT_0039152057 /DNA_START=60 /DNA_END=2446 /DNA_ORIENTATION=-